MKLSNNALNFLLAQYRAIFKRAYVKGLAPAIMLTAALAAGQAQAKDLAQGDWIDGSAIETVGPGDTFEVSDTKHASSLTVGAGHDLTTSGDIIVSGEMTLSGDLTIKAGSILLANIETVGESGNQTVYRHNLTSTGADLSLSGNIGTASFDISSGTLSLNAGGDGNTNLTAYGSGWNQAYNGSDITNADNYDRETANGTLSSMNVTVNSGTNVAALNLLTINDSTVNLAASGDSGSVDSGDTAYLEGSNEMVLSNTDITVDGYANGIFTQSGSITDSSITVNAEARLLLTGNANDYTEVLSGSANGNASTYTLSNTKINNAGTLTLGSGAAVSLSGATINNSGTLEVEEGASLTFASNYDLSDPEGTIDNSGEVSVAAGQTLTVASLEAVGVSDSSTGSFTLEEGATLALSEAATLSHTVVGKISGNGTVSGSDLTFDLSDAGASDTLTLGTNAYVTDKATVTTSGSDGFTLAADSTLTVGQLVLAEGAVNVSGALTLMGENSLTNQLNIQSGGSLSFASGANYTLTNLAVETDGTATIAQGTTATVNSLAVSGSVDLSGNLNVNGASGASDETSVGVSYADNAITINSDGVLTLNNNVLEHYIVAVEDGTTGDDAGVEGQTLVEGTLFNISDKLGTLNMQGGKLVLNYTDNTLTFSKEQIAELKSTLFAEGTSGILSVGEAKLGDITVPESGEVSLEDIQNSSAGQGATSNELDKATVVASGGQTIQTETSSVGSIKVSGTATTADMTGDWTLNSAASNTAGDGTSNAFIANESGKAMDVTTTGNLTLANGGAIGKVTVDGVDKTVTITNNREGSENNTTNIKGIDNASGDVGISGNTNSSDDIIAKNLNVSSKLTAQAGEGSAPVEIKAESLKATDGASINADSVTIGGSTSATTGTALASNFSAGTHNIGTLTFVDNKTSDAVTVNQSVTIDGNAQINVAKLVGSAGTTLYVGSDGESGSTGNIYSKATSSNGMLMVSDPEWGQASSSQIHEAIDSDGNLNNGADGIVTGGGFVAARNSYSLLGVDQATANDLKARYPLSETGMQALMVIGQALTLDDNNDGSYASLVVSGKVGSEAAKLADGSVYLDENATLYFTEDVAYGTTAAITFENNQGKITAAGGDVIVGGNITTDQSLKLFANADGSTPVDIVDANDAKGGSFVISSENGVFNTTVTDGDDLSNIHLELADDAAQRLSSLSGPIFDAAAKIASDSSMQGAGVAFVRDEMGKGTGAGIETAARLATFGGALQAGYMAAQTTSEMVSERLGVAKTTSGMIVADNAEGAGLWVSPFYKNHDSDGFDANGLNYGADIDLYGIALGADITTQSGVRVGALFNVGSGEAEGQEAASLASNDFDYYSLGLYVGFTSGNFNVTADLSYTETDNELSASSMKADTTVDVMSLGATAQYKLALGIVDVAPHLGLRYSNLSMDDYTVKNNGTAITEVDVNDLSVISIPFGVTVSSDLAVGSWTIKPAFDLTVTANTGDTDMDSDVIFTGANFGSTVNAEFMDDFTYGSTLGVSAAYGNFSIGADFSYVGSSNVDELGFSANARYTF